MDSNEAKLSNKLPFNPRQPTVIALEGKSKREKIEIVINIIGAYKEAAKQNKLWQHYADIFRELAWQYLKA